MVSKKNFREIAMTLKRPELQILLDKDNPTKVEMLTTVARSLKRSHALFVPEDCLDRCGGCGRVKKKETAEPIKLPNGIVTQETFCKDCVEKWKAGH